MCVNSEQIFLYLGMGSGGWDSGYPPQSGFPGQQLLSDPMATMAMQYGQTIADQGKQIVEEKVILFSVALCSITNMSIVCLV